MVFIETFIAEYGTTIMYTILTALAGYLGLRARVLVDKFLTDKTKKDVAKTVVQAVEQVYKDLHGEAKLNQALTAALEMLEDKGISITDLELRMLIEASLAEFNGAFTNP